MNFFVALNTPRIRWAVLGFAAVLLLFAQSSRTKLTTDPVVYAAIAKTMADSGNYGALALKLGDEPYYNKPPLLFWLSAFAIKIFGSTVFAVTLFSRIFGLACVFLTALLGSRLYDAKVGWAAGLILATTHLFFRSSATFRLESGLTFGILLSLYGYLNGERRWGPPLFYLGTCIAVLTKGIPGFLPLLTAPMHAFLSIPLRLWYKGVVRWLLWSPLLILPVLWWIHLVKTDGEVPLNMLLADLARTKGNHLSRIAEFWTICVVGFVKTYWPWLPFAVTGLWLSIQDLRNPQRERSARASAGFLLGWIAIVFVTSALKNAQYLRYIFIALPAISIMAAVALVHITPEKLFNCFAGIVALATLLAAVGIACFASGVPSELTQYQTMGQILNERLPARSPVSIIKMVQDNAAPELALHEKARALFFFGRSARLVSVDEVKRAPIGDRPTLLVKANDCSRLKALLPLEVLFAGSTYCLLETVR